MTTPTPRPMIQGTPNPCPYAEWADGQTYLRFGISDLAGGGWAWRCRKQLHGEMALLPVAECDRYCPLKSGVTA